jgi:hypothetical protein
MVGRSTTGRLTKIVDRNGNAIVLTYQYAANSTPTDRNVLWRISTITDPCGQT